VIVQLAMTDTFGLPFEAIVQRDLLGPLGMKDSTYEQPIPYALEQRTARGHDVRGNPMPAKWYVHPEQAAAGLWSTSRDLAQLVIEVQRSLDGSPGRVLSKAMGRELTTTVGVGPFALGFIPVDGGKGAHVHYGGRNRGFYAAIWGHRSGYGLTVMTNGDGGDKVADEIWARVAAVYDWDPLNDNPSTYDTLRCQPQLRTLRQ
jgi:CubicO group peptidase (beta-lactamase class C family)